MRCTPVLLLLLPVAVHAQQWVDLLDDPRATLPEIQQAFNDHWSTRSYERGNGWKQFKRMEWYLAPRLYPSGHRPDPALLEKAWDQVDRQRKAGGPKSANWAPLGPLSWTSSSYNPGNGRVNVFVVDPSDPSTIYVGAPAGGLWRSADDGNSWTALFDDLPTLGVSGIAIDPTDPDVLYVSTGDGDGRDTYSMGVIKSTDGGATWNTTGLNWSLAQVRTTRKLLMHPTDPQVLFCCSNDGLWKTIDGAATWTRVAEGSFWDVEFRPGAAQFMYACTDQFHGSIDGGDNFLAVDIGLPPADQVRRMSIAVTPANDQYVYVLCGREDDAGFQGLYRSINGGFSFTQRSTTPNIFSYDENGSDSGGQSWYDMALCADPANAGTIYAGGINVWKSTNGGTNWTIVSHWTWPSAIGYTHADIHALEIFNGDLYCGSDGGIFRSGNAGGDWNDLSQGLDITQFYRLGGSEMSPGMLIAGAQDNGCNLLQGGDWTHVQGADGMECVVDPTDPQIMYASSQNGGLNRSDDGGQDFDYIASDISEDGAWVTPYLIDPNDEETLYAGFNNVWKSTDRGNNWAPISSFGGADQITALAVAPSNSDCIYIVRGEQLRRTLNGGLGWPLAVNGLPVLAPTGIAIHPLHEQTAYLCFSGFLDGEKVYVTTNAGASWTNISGNLPNVPVNTIVFQEGSAGGIYAGTDLGVFYTDSMLGNWQPFNDGLPLIEITELEINYTMGLLRASTFGRGLWQSELYLPSGLPPVASFTAGNANICAGGTITFDDASLEAAPGWTWDFPGGTPSSSTDASPSVTYAASGTYTVSLTVSNAFGSDTHTLPLTVNVLPNLIDVSITLDDYPQESSWSITNDGDGEVVVTGGPYEGLADGSSVSEQVCLALGCYTFTIHDSYGDGICCDDGNGSYTVTSPDLGLIASGGEFTFGESTPFCVSLPVGVAPVHFEVPALLVQPINGHGLFALTLAGVRGPYDLKVVDATGRVVQDMRIERTTLAGEQIDLSRQAAGTYALRVHGAEGSAAATLVKY